MCGRFTLRTSPGDLAAWFLNASLDLTWPAIRPRFNIAPTQGIVCVRVDPNEADRCEVVQLLWGLIPPWSPDKKSAYKMINARSETIHEKPSFRGPFRKRRCLIVADGFYEWVREGEIKRPFHISMNDGSPFCFAGIWERWNSPEGAVESAAILTTSANSLMARIHDRMPVILPPQDFRHWLTAQIPAAGEDPQTQSLLQLLQPFPADRLQAIPVSTLVNSVRNESPDCLLPVE